MSVNMYILCCCRYCRCCVLILSGYGVPSECSDGIFSGSDMVDNQFFALVVEDGHIHIEQGFDVCGGENVVGLALHGDLAVFHGDDVVGVGGGLVDVVQYDDGGALVFVGQPAQDLHEAAGMIHVEVVQRFVQQNVVGALAEYHGNHGALALAAGKLGQVAVGEVLQVELGKRVFDNGFVVFRRPALVVGIAAEHEQVAHGNAAHDAVFLGEDRERAGEFGGGGGFDVFACVADVAVYQRLKPRHKGEEGGFACAVWAD